MLSVSMVVATVVFWSMGVGLVAYALAFIDKRIRAYYICIIFGNAIILLTSPLIYQSEFNIGILTMVMVSAQIKSGLGERKRLNNGGWL
tara:strand:+ start:668 stop:934 length:267 start_codon:yes stop_codon:yes gene_type:complete